MKSKLNSLKHELDSNCRHYQPLSQSRISSYDDICFECPGCFTFVDCSNYKLID